MQFLMQYSTHVLSVVAIIATCLLTYIGYQWRRPSLFSPWTYVLLAFIAFITFGLASVAAESRAMGFTFVLAVVGGFVFSATMRWVYNQTLRDRDQGVEYRRDTSYFDPPPVGAWRKRRKRSKAFLQLGPSDAPVGMTSYDKNLNVDATGQLLDYRA